MNKKLTTKEFIKRANKIHGNKYDYSEVKYTRRINKIIIICPKHGKFKQLPPHHLKGCGCPKCGREKNKISTTLTTEEFIINAKKVHGNKYDYSKTRYFNSYSKVVIICPIHGKFKQNPRLHTHNMSGCPKCNFHKRSLTLEEFIKRSKKTHKNKYNYSKIKIKFTTRISKVAIICPMHGKFKQTVHAHLKGHGCPKCNYEERSLTLEQFIKRSKKTHKNKYDYSKVKFINKLTKVTIICPTHGKFKRTPKEHILSTGNYGCPKCSLDKSRNLKFKQFIENTKKIHGDKYDYSEVKYINTGIKVTIICKKHGKFEQSPNCHINQKQNCPICRSSKGEIETANWLNNNNIKFIHQKKFKECINYKKFRKTLLRFDFYIPKLNICIEYDGMQHYKPINFGYDIYYTNNKKSLERLKINKQNDRIKNKYCKNNNIKLLRIPYTKFYKIDDILNEFIFNEMLNKQLENQMND